jgi:hypothetical protein
LTAVGWLEVDHPYRRGEVDPDWLRALTEFAREPWQPVICSGVHRCSLCGPRPVLDPIAFHRLVIGASNLLIPGDHEVFVAPELIVHYITGHGYRPTERF